MNNNKIYIAALLSLGGYVLYRRLSNTKGLGDIPGDPPTGTVEGNVCEYPNGLGPISGVTVTARSMMDTFPHPPPRSATTGPDGYYVIEDLRIGDLCAVEFEKTGYVSTWKEIGIKADMNTCSLTVLERIGE